MAQHPAGVRIGTTEVRISARPGGIEIALRIGPAHAAGFGHVIEDALADELLALPVEAAGGDRRRRRHQIEAAAPAALPGRKRSRIRALPSEKWLSVSAASVKVSGEARSSCGSRAAATRRPWAWMLPSSIS